MHAAFQRQGARPQVEFLAELFPGLPARLKLAGSQEGQRQPVLLLHQRDMQSLSAPPQMEFLALTQASSLEEIRENLDTNTLGFNEPAGATEREVVEFRAGPATSRAFTLRVDGYPVAAGMLEAIRGGVTELLGIATLPAFRRRGFDAYLTAAMAESAFACGATLVFLCAVSQEAARVYERVRFPRARRSSSMRANRRNGGDAGVCQRYNIVLRALPALASSGGSVGVRVKMGA
jgi:ribosomal protein S18 acetylase RimI-like enzyme